VTKGLIKAALARAYSNGAEPTYVSIAPNGRDEMWAIGDMAFVVPVVPSDAPLELKFALRVRRNALLTGHCDECGAIVGTNFEAKLAEINIAGSLIPHRRNCPAADHLVRPQLEQYYASRSDESLVDALEVASQKTRNELEQQLTSRIELPKDTYGAWAQDLIDRKSNGEVVEMCDHLKVDLAQTWTMLLGLDKWHCDECWAYLQHEILERRFQLPMLEEHTCDYCSRYVADLQPLVVRVNNFVMRGGMCRRCARIGSQYSEAEVSGRPHV